MKRCRLLTFNIAHARGLGIHQGLRTSGQLRRQLLKIAHLINRLDVDIVALQEIDENSLWNGSFDHLAYLRDHSGLPHAAYGITNRRAGRFHLNYGNAVLSRWPLTLVENVPFGRRNIGEKGFLYTEVDVGRNRRLPLINVHLHHASRSERLKQVRTIMDFIEARRTGGPKAKPWVVPPVVCGDFNNPAHWPDATAVLLGYFEEHNNYTLLPKGVATFPSPWPQSALDHVFLPQECGPVTAEVVKTMLSDHRPVMVEFRIPVKES